MVADMLGIIIQKQREAPVDQRFIDVAGRGKAPFQQLARAMADHDADARVGDRGTAELDQGMVERGGQVGSGIDKRAVEVESDAVEGYNQGHQPAMPW
jgi:hypothetical protein